MPQQRSLRTTHIVYILVFKYSNMIHIIYSLAHSFSMHSEDAGEMLLALFIKCIIC